MFNLIFTINYINLCIIRNLKKIRENEVIDIDITLSLNCC